MATVARIDASRDALFDTYMADMSEHGFSGVVATKQQDMILSFELSISLPGL